ncbi:MAG: hypothetical protein ACOYL6_08280 [Bacteriovoracaceae bacterium]
MGVPVLNNQIFDGWLTRKTDEILSKVDKEKISTEEMIILMLKAQTNHFHHMDDECKGEFKRIDGEFRRIDNQFNKVNERFKDFRNLFMWQTGLLVALFAGLYLKIFFN